MYSSPKPPSITQLNHMILQDGSDPKASFNITSRTHTNLYLQVVLWAIHDKEQVIMVFNSNFITQLGLTQATLKNTRLPQGALQNPTSPTCWKKSNAPLRLFALAHFNGHDKRKKSSKLDLISHTCVFFLFLYIRSSMCTLEVPLGELGPKKEKENKP